MTVTNGSRWFQKSILSLLGLAALALPGRAFQIAAELPSAAAAGTPSNGVLHGVTKGPNGQSVFGVQVTVQNVDEKIKRTVLSGADGNFLIADLAPGKYRLSARAEGIGAASPATVEIAQNQVTYANVQLGAEAPAQPAETSVPDAGLKTRSVEPLSASSVAAELAAMKARIELLEAELQRQSSQGRAPLVAAAKPAPEAAPAPAVPAAAPAPPQAPAAPAPPAPSIPEALQANESTPGVDNFTPFAYGDFTWLNGTPRNKDTVLDTKFFTPEVRFDTHYMEDYNQPIDHTIVGATESFRSGEVQVEQISVGGDFHWQNVRGRVLYMDGLFATTTPRNDASAGVGQWDLRDAYKYVSEAYGGYHFNVNHGLNVDAGIFVSYIGLFSYYNFDNWTYQPSYVSSNTPWFFNGVRVQWFPTNKLKIEPWFINGWQSYAKYNGHPGLGGQLLWEPKEWFKLVANQYGYGQDNLGLPKTERIHTDDSILVRYYSKPESLGLSKMAFSLTADAGCQYGGGLQCTGAPSKGKSTFIGWMLYDRMWFHKDKFGLTLGGGEMSNWGRYLTLLPPIDGADAVSGTPYFTENPGQRAHMWDSTITFQYMPRQYITWWAEAGYRHSDIPYFAGRGGVTPPGGNNGDPQYYTCSTGATSGTNSLAGAEAACGGGLSSVWFPDLRRSEFKTSVGVMVKF
jgi:putative OmpL-like beta-barrel porin-2/carboxypeptidase family protein